MDNSQALGYMLLACKQLDLEVELVRKLKREMYFQFDLKTETEAEKLGNEYYQNLT